MAIKVNHPIPPLIRRAGELMSIRSISNHRRSGQGFTLIELLVGLALLLILSRLASPVFADVIQTIRLTGTVHELHNAIRRTRNEAIKRNSLVRLSALNGDWKNGWQMLDRDEHIITTHPALHPTMLIEARFGNGTDYIAFDGVGHNRHIEASGGALYGHISISIGNQTRLIVVNALGHSRVCNPARDKACGTNAPD